MLDIVSGWTASEYHATAIGSIRGPLSGKRESTIILSAKTMITPEKAHLRGRLECDDL
jgi:hypothetical protein